LTTTRKPHSNFKNVIYIDDDSCNWRHVYCKRQINCYEKKKQTRHSLVELFVKINCFLSIISKEMN